MKLCNRLAILCLFFTLITPGLSLAEGPFEGLRTTELAYDIDWEGTHNLLFYGLPKNRVIPGSNELHVRISQEKTPLFFERIVFEGSFERPEPPATPLGVDKGLTPDLSKAGVELFANHPVELSGLLEKVRAGAKIMVSLQLNGETVFEGRLRRLMKGSDSLREFFFAAVPGTSHLADLRPVSATEGFEKVACNDCDSDYADCQVDFCYWDYDAYMCNTGCDLEYDQCRATCTPPTCTARLLSTSTSTQVTNAQYAGSQCFQGFMPWESHLYFYYWVTYKHTTTETHQRTDCTTYQVSTTSYSNAHCFNNTFAPCGLGGGWPFCVF